MSVSNNNNHKRKQDAAEDNEDDDSWTVVELKLLHEAKQRSDGFLKLRAAFDALNLPRRRSDDELKQRWNRDEERPQVWCVIFMICHARH